MGFKDIIGAIFGPKLERVTVNIDELEKWTNERISKAVSSKMDGDKKVFEEFNSMVVVLNKTVNDLEFAELLNDKIDQRMKNYMTGNRETYVKQMRIFLANLPEFEGNFHEEFQAQLTDFSERTRRNFAVLTEFFKDTMIEIARNLKRMDELSGQLLYDNDKLMIAEDIKREVATLINFDGVQNELKKKIDELDLKIEKAIAYITETQSKISELKSGKEYELLESLGNLIKDEQEKLRKIECEVHELFSPLKKSMKKFSYITINQSDKKTIDSYIEDSVEALLKDIKLSIIDILYRMEKGLSNLDVKDSEKARADVKKISKTRLEGLIKDIKKLKSLIRGAEADLEKIEILNEISKLDREIEQVSNRQSEFEAEKQKIIEEIETMSRDETIEHLRKHVKDLLKVDLIITENNVSVKSTESSLETVTELEAK